MSLEPLVGLSPAKANAAGRIIIRGGFSFERGKTIAVQLAIFRHVSCNDLQSPTLSARATLTKAPRHHRAKSGSHLDAAGIQSIFLQA